MFFMQYADFCKVDKFDYSGRHSASKVDMGSTLEHIYVSRVSSSAVYNINIDLLSKSSFFLILLFRFVQDQKMHVI